MSPKPPKPKLSLLLLVCACSSPLLSGTAGATGLSAERSPNEDCVASPLLAEPNADCLLGLAASDGVEPNVKVPAVPVPKADCGRSTFSAG
jgi:hypothetical protein